MRRRTACTPAEAAPPAGGQASITPHPELPTPSWNVPPPLPRRANTRAAPTWVPRLRSATPGRTSTSTITRARTERSRLFHPSRCWGTLGLGAAAVQATRWVTTRGVVGGAPCPAPQAVRSSTTTISTCTRTWWCEPSTWSGLQTRPTALASASRAGRIRVSASAARKASVTKAKPWSSDFSVRWSKSLTIVSRLSGIFKCIEESIGHVPTGVTLFCEYQVVFNGKLFAFGTWVRWSMVRHVGRFVR
jgi:hypothetical protein